ncbi:Unknown protein [Striga hermonthica]|uniref:DUF4283 domain-containing protein n=1 Tax=Striga hermonthica TaxID=68872 RepID=A0A9N7R9V6_STRHE|nr:Unknown protein [Striga hermonthica]
MDGCQIPYQRVRIHLISAPWSSPSSSPKISGGSFGVENLETFAGGGDGGTGGRAEPFDNALILKFSFTVPSLRDLSVSLVKLGFKGRVTSKFLNYNHYLLYFELKEDYNSIWIKTHLNIFGCPGRVFKYTPDFSFVEESSIVPVWCCFLGLLPHLFDPSALFSTASCIGNPIETDSATTNRSRLSVARVCVEVDLRDELIKEIELDQAGKTTIQKVIYERVPPEAEFYYRPISPKEKGKAPAHGPNPKGLKGKSKVTSEGPLPKEVNLDRPKAKATCLSPTSPSSQLP